MRHLIGIICLALGGTIGMTCLILACALKPYNIWWPFFVVLFYILALLPRILVRTTNTTGSYKDASTFFSVGMILSCFALPIVLARAEVIKTGASYLTVAANFVNIFTMAMYFRMTESEDGSYMGNY